MIKKKLTPTQAYSKILKYCAYQERCHQEVESKLYEFGLYKLEVGNIIVKLMEHNFLNEERFARSFVRGKFRSLKWGKAKITWELKQKRINDRLIKMALTEITDEDYNNTIISIIEKKTNGSTARLSREDYQKVCNHLLSKGFTYSEFATFLNGEDI